MRLLAPLLGEARLGGRVAVGVLQPLDVAEQHRADPDALHEAVEVADDAGLVAVDVGEDHARPCRPCALRSGPSVPSSSGFISSDVLAVLDRGEHRAGGLLDRAGHLEQHVDMRARRHQHRVLGDRAAAGLDGAGERGRAVADRRVRPRRPGHRRRPPSRACGWRWRRCGWCRGRRADLQRHARGHEAGADHADPDRRLALGHVPGERGVDDDHGVAPSRCLPTGVSRRIAGIRIAALAYEETRHEVPQDEPQGRGGHRARPPRGLPRLLRPHLLPGRVRRGRARDRLRAGQPLLQPRPRHGARHAFPEGAARRGEAGALRQGRGLGRHHRPAPRIALPT